MELRSHNGIECHDFQAADSSAGESHKRQGPSDQEPRRKLDDAHFVAYQGQTVVITCVAQAIYDCGEIALRGELRYLDHRRLVRLRAHKDVGGLAGTRLGAGPDLIKVSADPGEGGGLNLHSTHAILTERSLSVVGESVPIVNGDPMTNQIHKHKRSLRATCN